MKGKIKKIASSSLIALALVGGGAVAVNGQTATETPVDKLENEMDKLSDVYDDIVPVAIGAAAFSIGMVLIKRIAFS